MYNFLPNITLFIDIGGIHDTTNRAISDSRYSEACCSEDRLLHE